MPGVQGAPYSHDPSTAATARTHAALSIALMPSESYHLNLILCFNDQLSNKTIYFMFDI